MNRLTKPAFSLVELLISIAIFLVTLILFVSTLKQVKIISHKTEEQLKNSAYIDSKMEELWQMPSASLSAYNGAKFAEGRGVILVTKLSDKLWKVELNLLSTLTGSNRQLVSWRGD